MPPLPGRSLVPLLARDGPLEREFLFFQHEGNRALRQGNWKLVSAREDEHVWELYDLSRDRSELNNLAAQQPDRVRELAQAWTNHVEACRALANVGGQDRPPLKRPGAETNRANRRPEGTQR